MHDRPVNQRIHDFCEVDAGMTPEEAAQQLEDLRLLVDDVDRRIVALLNDESGAISKFQDRVRCDSQRK